MTPKIWPVILAAGRKHVSRGWGAEGGRRTADGDRVGHVDNGGIAFAIAKDVDKIRLLQRRALGVVKLGPLVALGGNVGRRACGIHPQVGRARVEDKRHRLPGGSDLNVDHVRRAGPHIGNLLALHGTPPQARKPGDGMDGRMEKPLTTGDDGALAGLDGWGRCDKRRGRQQRGGEEGGEHGDDVVWLSDGRVSAPACGTTSSAMRGTAASRLLRASASAERQALATSNLHAACSSLCDAHWWSAQPHGLTMLWRSPVAAIGGWGSHGTKEISAVQAADGCGAGWPCAVGLCVTSWYCQRPLAEAVPSWRSGAVPFVPGLKAPARESARLC